MQNEKLPQFVILSIAKNLFVNVVKGMVIKMYKKYVKRFIDIVLSFIGTVVLIPIFLIVGLVIYIDDPGPIFFTQKRMGKNKKMFWMYKFRSMKVNSPEIPGYLLENPDEYITRVGKIIRKLSIDELPQIFNILKGNMSIIGYRPSLYENEDELVNERDKYFIHDCKPGLTGWAQINGRDEITIELKVKYDAQYVETLNAGGFKAFYMDVKCFVKTVLKVLKSDGVVEGTIDANHIGTEITSK